MFWEKSKKIKEDNKKPEEFGSVDVKKDDEANSRHVDMSKFLNFEPGVLKGFYISEKVSTLNSFNQTKTSQRRGPSSRYIFKVFNNVTKSEIKKQVEKSFDVKVKNVKTINLPRKARTVGRHSGFKTGLKKAIVVLKEGYVIEQAKP